MGKVMTSRSDLAGKRTKPKRHWWKVSGGLVAAVVLGWLIYATANILDPSQGDLQAQSDAIVSLAPQTFRLPLAQQLVTQEAADTLLISYFDHDPLNFHTDPTLDVPLSEFCEAEAPYEILCFTPEENATIGETYAVAQIARERSWNSLTVVTDTTHAFRTRYIFDQCLGNEFELNIVVADPDMPATERAWHAVYENAAFLKAVWQTAWRC